MQQNVRMWTTCIFKGGGYGVWNYDKDKILVRSSRQFYKSFTWILHQAQLPDVVKDLIIFKMLINLINASKIIPLRHFFIYFPHPLQNEQLKSKHDYIQMPYKICTEMPLPKSLYRWRSAYSLTILKMFIFTKIWREDPTIKMAMKSLKIIPLPFEEFRMTAYVHINGRSMMTIYN